MTGLLRLLLVLLLALPSMQPACAQVDARAGHTAMAMHHGAHHQAPRDMPAVHHECIGCIAPIDVDFYRPVSAPGLVSSCGAQPADTALPLLPAATPEPPPPRNTV